MSDAPTDALLRDLGRRAAERERSGTGEPEAEAAITRQLDAARRPLDAAAKARIVARLKNEIPHTSPNTSQGFAGADAVTAPRPRRMRWAMLPLAAALVAALSTLVFRAGQAPETVGTISESLPIYTLRIEGANQRQRATHAPPFAADPGDSGRASIRAALGNQLRIQLTPQHPADAPLVARAHVQRGGDPRWTRVAPALVSVSDHGAVRLDAVLGTELAVAADTQHHLLLVVGHAETLPAPESAARASEATGEATGPGWRAYRLTLEVSAAP